MTNTGIITWLLQEADDWEPDGTPYEKGYEEGYRSPTAGHLREAAGEIERLRAALYGLRIHTLLPSEEQAIICGPWPSIMALHDLLEPLSQATPDSASEQEKS